MRQLCRGDWFSVDPLFSLLPIFSVVMLGATRLLNSVSIWHHPSLAWLYGISIFHSIKIKCTLLCIMVINLCFSCWSMILYMMMLCMAMDLYPMKLSFVIVTLIENHVHSTIYSVSFSFTLIETRMFWIIL